MRTKQSFSDRSLKHAFTLVELMITLGIFVFVAAGMLELHLIGLRLQNMANVKLEASEGARKALGRLVTDIHSAGVVYVGNWDGTKFTAAAFNTPQEGNALEIYPDKTSTNTFILYYLGADNRLKRIQSGDSAPTTIAGAITNNIVFTSEDFAGNILSNNFNNRVIGVTLQFFQLDNPMIQIGPGNVYDYYQLQTRVTRRALE